MTTLAGRALNREFIMAQAAIFVTDQKSYQMCTLSGLATMSGKLSDLEDVRRGILISIKETKEAKTSLERWSAALFGAKMLKAACDGFISIAASFAGPQGKIISGAYQASTGLADAGTKAALGQQVDVTKMAINVAGGAATAVIGKKQMPYDRLKNLDGATDRLRALAEQKAKNLDTLANLVSTQKVKSEVVVDAVRADEKDLWKSFEAYSWELSVLTADGASESLGKAVGGIKELVTFGKALKENLEEFKNDSDTKQFDGIVRNFEAQLLRINDKIGSLQTMMAACERELAIA
jgi:hypothetical protein